MFSPFSDCTRNDDDFPFEIATGEPSVPGEGGLQSAIPSDLGSCIEITNIARILQLTFEAKTECNRNSIRVPSLDIASRFALKVKARSRIMGRENIPTLDDDPAFLAKLIEEGFCDDSGIIDEFIRLLLEAKAECYRGSTSIPALNRAIAFVEKLREGSQRMAAE